MRLPLPRPKLPGETVTEPSVNSPACSAFLSSADSEYVMDLLEADRKLLVFAHHKELLDTIEHDVMKVTQPFVNLIL